MIEGLADFEPPLVHYPWVGTDGEDGPVLSQELALELAPGHPLFGEPCTPIVRCSRCDDVIFAVSSDHGWFAKVRLTWRRGPEDLPYPMFEAVTPPFTPGLSGHPLRGPV